MDLETWIRDVYRKPTEPFTTARARLAIEIGISQGTLIRAIAKKTRIHRGNAVAISAATVGSDGEPLVSVDELIGPHAAAEGAADASDPSDCDDASPGADEPASHAASTRELAEGSARS